MANLSTIRKGPAGAAGAAGATGPAGVVSASGTAPLTLAYDSGTQAVTGSVDTSHLVTLDGSGNVALTGQLTAGGVTFPTGVALTSPVGGVFSVSGTIDVAGNVSSVGAAQIAKYGGSYNVINGAAIGGVGLTTYPPSASEAGFAVKGLASQSGDLQQWRASDNTVLAAVSAAGSLTAAGATFTGAVNLGGASGHSYFDANGDLRATAGNDLNFKRSDGLTTFLIKDGGIPTAPYGFSSIGLTVGTSGLLSFNGGSIPLYLTSAANLEPVVLGDTSTALTGGAIDLALPTVLRSTLQLASINTGTTPGTAPRQVGIDSSTGKLIVWNGSSWI